MELLCEGASEHRLAAYACPRCSSRLSVGRGPSVAAAASRLLLSIRLVPLCTCQPAAGRHGSRLAPTTPGQYKSRPAIRGLKREPRFRSEGRGERGKRRSSCLPQVAPVPSASRRVHAVQSPGCWLPRSLSASAHLRVSLQRERAPQPRDFAMRFLAAGSEFFSKRWLFLPRFVIFRAARCQVLRV